MARHNPMLELSPDTPKFAVLPRSTIRPHPDQPRKFIRDAYLKELADSIKEKGQLDPIKVVENKEEPDSYVLVDGQCRLKALESLGRDTVHAMILTEGDPLELSLILNDQREDMHPLDHAASYALLVERFNYTQEDLARVLGKPRATIAEILSLNDLPTDIQDECRASDIGKTHLIELVRMLDRPEEMRSLFERIQSGERIPIRELRGRRQGRPVPSRPADLPKALMPVIRAIDAIHRVRDQLAKIQPSSIISGHPETLEELRELHKEIGASIKKLERGGDSGTVKPGTGRRQRASAETMTAPGEQQAENAPE